MKRFIQTEHTVNAPVNNLWAKIAQGDGCENWLSIIKDSKVEGNKRVCTMHEGHEIEETIIAADHSKTFMYSIDKQEVFPASDIVGLIKLESIDQNTTKVYWDVEMNVQEDEAFTQIKGMIEQVYAKSLAKLAEIV